MATSPDDSLGDSPYSDDELRLLWRVEKSVVWRCLQDMLVMERERLFAGTSYIEGLDGQPTETPALHRNRGAILFIQHLLREGPQSVISYERHRKAQADERLQRKVSRDVPLVGERTFTPGAPREGFEDKPEFDVE